MIHFCLQSMQTINKKHQRLVSQILLAFYLVVSVGFIFHYHHISLASDSIVKSQSTSNSEFPVSGNDRDGFVCIIHSNFQSLHTAFQVQIFGSFTSLPFPILNFVEVFNSRIIKLQQSTANPLRAPPQSFC